MLFSSLAFICCFLFLTITIYYIIPSRRFKNVYLLCVSLFFYGWGELEYLYLLLICIIGNYIFALLAQKFRQEAGKPIMAGMVIFNLGILGYFKYADFLIATGNEWFGLANPLPEIALPLGISFFTFQGMSYVIDVYRKEIPAWKNPLDVGLYIAFFPQLIAGPIVRCKTIAASIHQRQENIQDFSDGIALFCVGLGKKVLFANSFAIGADKMFSIASTGSISVTAAWLGAIFYALQIYFDFSGYSDMAIGLGRMFGFHFMKNFNYPYISRSVSEFWRRWHISLGSWFRDYVYIPLGGSRVGKPRLVFNLAIVWFLTGLWHGANWTFILWGAYYGLFIIFEKLTGFDKKLEKLPIISNILILIIVLVGWVFFRADTLSDAIFYLQSMFHLNGNALTCANSVYQMSENYVLLILAIFACLPLKDWGLKLLKCDAKNLTATRRGQLVQVLVAIFAIFLLLASIASLAKGIYNPFIYFNF